MYAKVFTDLKKLTKKSSTRSGLRASWRACANREGSALRHRPPRHDDSHRYAFGNTEDDACITNLGCSSVAAPENAPYNHNTGKGYFIFSRFLI